MLMLIPDKSAAIWRDLITGEKEYRFRLVPASMMLARLMRSVQLNGSDDNINQCAEELYHFFTHYHVVLSKDIQILFGEQGNNNVANSASASMANNQRQVSTFLPLR
jgi:hypothetical protein